MRVYCLFVKKLRNYISQRNDNCYLHSDISFDFMGTNGAKKMVTIISCIIAFLILYLFVEVFGEENGDEW